MSDFYYKLSKIDYLKEKIIEQVETKGKFFRVKTFIDIISNPILNSMENLLSQSQVNSTQGRTIVAKKRQLEEWKQQFCRDGLRQIHSLIAKIESELNSEATEFSEEHFSDENADKAWKSVLIERNIETRCQELLESLEDKLKEISREISNELKFTALFVVDKSIKMDKIIDKKSIWNWSSIIIGSGLTIGAGIAWLIGAAATGPLGWAALAVTGIGILGSFFFESRNKKESDARIRLENKLKENIKKTCSSLQSKMEKNLKKLISIRIDGLIHDMNNINTIIFKLADTQRELAWGLNEHLLEMNKQIVTEGIKLIGAEGLQYHVQSVARIPGSTSLIMLRDGDVFPKEQSELLYKLMSERINFVYETENKRVLISRVLGKKIDRKRIKLEEKIGVAYVPIVDETPNLISRVRLAQQFSKMQIVKL